MKKVQCPQCNSDSGNDHIWVHSGVNSEAKGFVHIAWGLSTELRAQFTPEEARQHALTLLEVAEAAEQDSMVVRFFQTSIGSTLQEGMRFVSRLRQFRDISIKED